MRRKLAWTAIGLAVLAAFLAVGINWSKPVVGKQALADGSVMILRGVTYGRVHQLALGNLLQRSAGQVLPASAARRLGLQVLTYSNSAPCLMVWAEQKRPGTTRRPTGG